MDLIHLQSNIEYAPRLLEAASWRISTEIQRRLGDQVLILEAHPSGGHSNCISLYHEDRGLMTCLNVGGTSAVLFPFEQVEHEVPLSLPGLWHSYFSAEDPKEVIDELCRLIGIRSTQPQHTTRRVLSYRLIASILTHQVFSRTRRRFLSGYLDTSGFGGGVRTELFRALPSTQALRETIEALSEGDQWCEARGVWFYVEPRGEEFEPIIAIDSRAHVHFRDRGMVDAMQLFKTHKRRVSPTMMNLFQNYLPD